MSTELDLLRLAREAKKGATKIKTRINRVVVDLNPKAIPVMTEAALEAANAWRDVADLLRERLESPLDEGEK